MIRKLKIGGLFFVVVIVALVVAVIATLNAIDLNSYRDAIAAEVEAATGRKLTIAGQLDLAIGLRPSLVVDDVSLANIEGGSRPDMATIERLEAVVDLLALLSGDIVIERLVVIGADLLLETDKKGRSNWVFGDQPRAAEDEEAPAIPGLNDVLIERSTVSYLDGKTRHTLKIGELAARSRGNDKPLALTFDGSVDDLPVSLKGEMGVDTDKQAYAIKALSASLPGADIGGDVVLTLSGKRPHLKGALGSKKIELDKLLPASPKASGSGSAKPEKDDGRVFPDDPLPLAALTALDAELTYKAKEVIRGKIRIRDIDAVAMLRDGILKLDRLTAKLSKGSIKLSASFNGAKAPGTAALKLALDKADLSRLMKATAESDLLSGQLDLKIDARGRGRSVRALMAKLNGRANLVVTDGYVASQVLDLLAADLLTSLTPGSKTDEKGTKINCVIADFPIKSGLATAQVLLLDTERMTVTGDGTVNLATEKLKLQLKPKPKDPSLLSLATPVNIGGTMANPSAAPDTVALATGAAAAVAGNVLLPGAGLLLPLLSAGSDDKHPCLQAVNQAGAERTGTSTAAPKASEKKKDGGIGGFLKGIGDSIDKTLGGKKE